MAEEAPQAGRASTDVLAFPITWKRVGFARRSFMTCMASPGSSPRAATIIGRRPRCCLMTPAFKTRRQASSKRLGVLQQITDCGHTRLGTYIAPTLQVWFYHHTLWKRLGNMVRHLANAAPTRTGRLDKDL